MEGHGADDPFASLIMLSYISTSQEDHLKFCPFAGNTDMEDDAEHSDSSELRVDSTGIVMVSLPDSCSPRDEYHTPPEGSAMASSDGQRSAVEGDGLPNDDRVDDETLDNTGTVVCDGSWMDGAKVVDLGRDTDVGFSSEVQLSQKSYQSTSVDRLDYEQKDIEQVFGLELPTFSTETTTEKTSGDVMKVFNELKDVGVDEEMLVLRNSGGEITELKKSPGKKIFNFSGELESNNSTETAIIGSLDLNVSITEMEFAETLEMEKAELRRVENGAKDNKGCNNDEDDMEYTDKCIVENTETSGVGMFKLLPPLVSGVKRKAAEELDSDASNPEVYRDVTILDVLKILKGEETDGGDDSDQENVSILDILKRRGMTFPRPSWWPEGGFCCSRSTFS